MTDSPDTTPFDSILAQLCSKATLQVSNSFQYVFVIEDHAEARLACELLAAHGFEVKTYQKDDGSTLYIARPDDTPDTQRKLAAALAYAPSLKRIKENIDALNASPALAGSVHQIAFTGNESNGKQIVVQIEAQTPISAAQSAVMPSAAVRQPAKKPVKKTGSSSQNSFSSGPALAKRNYPARMKKSGESDGSMRQLYLYVRGNMATGTMALFALVIFPAIIAFTLFVLLKGALCSDFATKKKTAWYCLQQEDDNKP